MIIFMPRLPGPGRPPKTVEECDRRIEHLENQIEIADSFLWFMVVVPWAILIGFAVAALVNWLCRG